MIKKVFFSIIMSCALFAVWVPAHTSAAQNLPTGYFCHRSSSPKNAYQVLKFDPNYSEIDGVGQNDHSLHTGPVPTSVYEAQQLKAAKVDWGDIIPPVPNVLPNGLNWTTEGQEIWNNGCQFAPETPVAYCDTLQAVMVSKYEYAFTAHAVVANGPVIESYAFNFGDGNVSGSQASNTANHTYATTGTYNASVTVAFMGTDEQTVTDTCTATVTIAADPTTPQVLGATTPQVTNTPTGGVRAGSGGASSAVDTAALGLLVSGLVAVIGIVRKFAIFM